MQADRWLFPNPQVPEDRIPTVLDSHSLSVVRNPLGQQCYLRHRALGQRWNWDPDLPFPGQGGSNEGKATGLREDSPRVSFLFGPLKKFMFAFTWISELGYEDNQPISAA